MATDRFKKVIRKAGLRERLSLAAHDDMDRMGINPLEMIHEVFQEAMKAYKSGRGLSDKSDSGPFYLSVAERAAGTLARFKHPVMSAIAVKDMTDGKGKAQISTSQEALEAIKADPFAPKEVKEVSAEKVIKSMKSTVSVNELPIGYEEVLDENE